MGKCGYSLNEAGLAPVVVVNHIPEDGAHLLFIAWAELYRHFISIILLTVRETELLGNVINVLTLGNLELGLNIGTKLNFHYEHLILFLVLLYDLITSGVLKHSLACGLRGRRVDSILNL
jgi:hypothetical protein